MLNQKLFCCLGISAIALLGSGLPAFSEETNKKEKTEVEAPPTSGETGKDCFADLPEEKAIEKLQNDLREANKGLPPKKRLSEEDIKYRTSLQSKRVELYYYRNAINIVNLLSKLPLGIGCVTPLPVNSLNAGQGVGRGGGNVLSLYGTGKYIDNAQRFITTLDLPLPGIDLQLWGVQISSDNPKELADSTSRVRSRLDQTRQILRDTFSGINGLSQISLQDKSKVDTKFRDIAIKLGYGDAIDGLGGEISILGVFLAGDALKSDQRVQFYQGLYEFLTREQDPTVKPYFDELSNDSNSPPFGRIFKSRGLKPFCTKKLKDDDVDNQPKCEKWQWKEEFVTDLDGNRVSLVDITANFERKVILEFALHYTDFLENPQEFDSEALQRTADNLNELLQEGSNLFQRDIEDLFLKPTLAMIQKEVGNNKKVEFAQVGRSTISTLDGVQTQIHTSSTSGFQISQSRNLTDLLSRAGTIQEAISSFLPTGVLGEATEATESAAAATEVAEIAATGGIPVSRLLGLAIASLERNATPLAIETGTSLAFTPGISRNLKSAELNIDLTVTDPTITPTAEESNGTIPPISRIGKQELHTTVYTEALDFFDLSTFTSQATLDGGRTPIPIIGDIWGAIFGAVPVFGDLFSFSNGNQNVLHESLILTNSFITPTPLSLANLYSPNNAQPPFKDQGFCTQILNLNDHFNSLTGVESIAGKTSFLVTKNIETRCPGIVEKLENGSLKIKDEN